VDLPVEDLSHVLDGFTVGRFASPGGPDHNLSEVQRHQYIKIADIFINI
jgi:hypothetical protein